MRSDGYITVNKKLAKAIGLHESIIYSELLSRYFYFANHNGLTDDGYFFNTIEDLEDGTTLTRHQQPKAINKLCKLNLIDCKIKGIPAKRYFKINENTNALLAVINEISQLSENRQTRSPKNGEQGNRKADGNNTKQVLKINKKYSTHSAVMGCVCFDFKILEKQIKNCYKKVSLSMSLDEVISVFKYFTDKHKELCNFEHPNMTNDTIISILNGIDTGYSIEMYFGMIDFYFTQNFVGNEKDSCDYSIKHFMSGDIITNCFYKACY